jgi:hypothetical protein
MQVCPFLLPLDACTRPNTLGRPRTFLHPPSARTIKGSVTCSLRPPARSEHLALCAPRRAETTKAACASPMRARTPRFLQACHQHDPCYMNPGRAGRRRKRDVVMCECAARGVQAPELCIISSLELRLYGMARPHTGPPAGSLVQLPGLGHRYNRDWNQARKGGVVSRSAA